MNFLKNVNFHKQIHVEKSIKKLQFSLLKKVSLKVGSVTVFRTYIKFENFLRCSRSANGKTTNQDAR